MNERKGIGGFVLYSDGGKHISVTGNFQIPSGEEIHTPDKRIEPVKTKRRNKNKFGECIEEPNVDAFVQQSIPRVLFPNASDICWP